MSAVAVPDLSQSPSRTRSAFARGLAVSESPVNREGGRFGQGLIRGVSVVTRADALGYGVWIDAEFLQATADHLNESERGIKARFTHPSLCSDGLGNYLGRFDNARVDGDQVRADLHLAEAGHKTKDGDMADYVMGLAEEDPEAFATSIVFTQDHEATQAHAVDNGGVLERDVDGYPRIVGFKSPDPLNTENLPHARMDKLHACDVVDEPAANPGGFFSNGDNFTAEIDTFFAYALGLSDDRPQLNTTGIDCDRARGFASRFLSARGLALTPIQKDAAMSDTPETVEAEVEESAVEEKPEAETEELAAVDEVQEEANEPEVDEPAEPEVVAEAEEPQKIAASEPSNGQKFLDAFGDKGGVWFAQGKSFDEATELHIEELTKENEDLKNRLSATDRGVDEPVEFAAVDAKNEDDAEYQKQFDMWKRGGHSDEEADRKAKEVLAKRNKK